MPPTLRDRLDPAQNSLTLIRLCLAALVVVSHGFVLATGQRIADPFNAWTGYSLGDHAVNVFFVLSGIVTTASLIRLRSPLRFIAARFLRVFPAVAVFALLFALVVAPLVSTTPLASYYTSSELVSYIVRTIAFAPGHPLLPGVFETNPMALITNEPLWTVKYEIICYLLLALAGGVLVLTGQRDDDAVRLLGLGAALVIIGYIVTTTILPVDLPTTLGHLRRFLYCFAIGVAAYTWADRIKLDWRWLLALAVLYALTFSTALRPAVSVLLTAYAAVMLATLRFGPLRSLTNRYDLSYGTYVLGWPVSQVLMALLPNLSILALTAATFAIVLPLALASWVFVEQPALGLKHRFARRRRPGGQLAAAEHSASR